MVWKDCRYQHTGYGTEFPVSSKTIASNERVNSYKFIDPEEVVSSNMIQILSDDDTLFQIEQTVPSYLFTVEKSMLRRHFGRDVTLLCRRY